MPAEANKPPTEVSEPRLFTVIRKADESGVSGTGRVLDGAIFHNGQVVVCWRGDIQARKSDDKEKGYSSISVYPCWEAFKHIHIDAHPDNKTEVVFGSSESLGEGARESVLLDKNVDDGEREK